MVLNILFDKKIREVALSFRNKGPTISVYLMSYTRAI